MTLKISTLLTALVFLALPLQSHAGIAAVQLASFSASPAFQISNIEAVPSGKSGSARFPLTIIVDSNSRWGEGQVKADIANTVAIYNKCGISVSPITIIEATHPQFGSINCATDYQLTKDIPASIPRPVVIYTSRLYCDAIGDASTAYSNPEFFAGSGEKRASLGTVFVTDGRLDFMNSGDPGYVVTMGHEIGHILLNQGHNYLNNNLMDNFVSKRGRDLTDEQCDTIRSSPFVTGLVQ